MEKADVVIVGGGVAGLAVALTLCSESNLDVVLVEERSVGSNRAVPAVFQEVIGEFGLEDSVLRYYTQFAFCSPLGPVARFDYRWEALAALDYRRACQVLYEQAAVHGLELRRVRAVNWSPATPDPLQPLFVHLDDGSTIQTQVLIDASGQAQWAARQLQIRLSPYHSICHGELLTNCSIEDTFTLWFLAADGQYGNGGGWFYPVGEDSASMGYAIIAREPHQPEASSVGYKAAKQGFRPFADWVREGVTRRMEGGVIPVGRIGRFVDHRVLIVGNAAGQANPWCMMGVNAALENGRLCAQGVLRAFARQRFDRSMLAEYERRWSRSNRERFWRATSVIEPVFLERSADEWARFIAAYREWTPEQQLRQLRDNRASLFQQAYAVGGYVRRQLVKWIRGVK